MSDRSRALKDVLWLFVFFGAVAIALRLWYGLGATTNLSDSVPWGLWKILNMVAGVALATGGFTVGLLAYVLGLERVRPLVKPAILVAFLGYGSSVFALVLDIGLPHRIWHPMVMWNPYSFLFEVAMCVAVYFTITIVELTPTLLERFPRWSKAVAVLHSATPTIVIFGITLSSLHHTSLGSLFLVTPQRLHPLWYSTWLPGLFIVSAMGAGMMMIVLVVMTWETLTHGADAAGSWRDVSTAEAISTDSSSRQRGLEILAATATALLALLLVLKVVDLVRTGAWTFLVAGSWESWLYLAELVLAAVVPVSLMLVPAVRRSRRGVAVAASVAVLGLVLNRLNVGIFGYFRDAGTVYFPSSLEWALSLGVIAAAALVLLIVAENFPVFDDRWQERASRRQQLQHGFDKLSGVWTVALGDGLGRVSLVAVFAVPLAWVLLAPPQQRAALEDPVRPPSATDPQRAVLRLDGNGSSLAVHFPHLDHRQRLGGDASCQHCHHFALPRDNATPCSRCHRSMHERSDLFDHSRHMAAVAAKEQLAGLHPGNRSCPLCHQPGQAESAQAVKPCWECHREDMKPTQRPLEARDLRHPPAYRAAFHGFCVACHQKEAVSQNRPALAECANCHPRGTTAQGSGAVVATITPPSDAPLVRVAQVTDSVAVPLMQ